MKKSSLVIKIFVLFCLFSLNKLTSSSIDQDPMTMDALIQKQLSASDYCNFLNQLPLNESNFLYDEKMGTDVHAACIVREGKPENYHYQVIAGRENFPIRYVSFFDKKAYRKEEGISSQGLDLKVDLLLKSNQSTFDYFSLPSSILSLVFSVSQPSSFRDSLSYFFQERGKVIPLLLLPIIMTQPGSEGEGARSVSAEVSETVTIQQPHHEEISLVGNRVIKLEGDGSSSALNRTSSSPAFNQLLTANRSSEEDGRSSLVASSFRSSDGYSDVTASKVHRRAPKYSDDLATRYSSERNNYNETDERVLEVLNNYIDIREKNILDLGCGGGELAVQFAQMGAECVTGVDISPAMIALAEAKGIDNMQFFVADMRDLSIVPEHSQDMVFSNYVIQHLSDTSPAFKEIQRILKPGGWCVITCNITTIITPGLEHLYNTIMPIRLGDEEKSVVVQDFIKPYSEIVGSLLSNGFTIVHEEELSHPHAVIDPSFEYYKDLKKQAMLFILKK